MESHFFIPKLFLGLGILEVTAPGEVTGAGEAGPGADLCMMLRLGLGASGGRGLVPVTSIPGGELASLCSPGMEVTEEDIMQGVERPEDGRDCSLLTGILLGTAGNCLPVLFTGTLSVKSTASMGSLLSMSIVLITFNHFMKLSCQCS